MSGRNTHQISPMKRGTHISPPAARSARYPPSHFSLLLSKPPPELPQTSHSYPRLHQNAFFRYPGHTLRCLRWHCVRYDEGNDVSPVLRIWMHVIRHTATQSFNSIMFYTFIVRYHVGHVVYSHSMPVPTRCSIVLSQ